MTENKTVGNLNEVVVVLDRERGNVSAWDFKSYPLAILFYRFASARQAEWFALETQRGDQQAYWQLDDTVAEEVRDRSVTSIGFFIRPSDTFDAIREGSRLGGDVTDLFAAAAKRFEESASTAQSKGDVSGLLTRVNLASAVLAATHEGRAAKLKNLFDAIAAIEAKNQNQFGEVFDHLVNKYASEAGKAGNDYFTTPAVSELLARLAIADRSALNGVYDPTCGTGSTLLRVSQILGSENTGTGLYGQELNSETSRFARMSMFLHGLNYDRFEIECADTLLDPRFREQAKFDAVVAHPPMGLRLEGPGVDGLRDDPRFADAGGLGPRSRADLAFVQHSLSYLSDNGIAAILLAPAALYREGMERRIRRYLVRNNLIDTVILLPSGSLTSTAIQMCVLVLKRNRTNEDVLFINADGTFPKIGASPDQLADATKLIAGLALSREVKLGISSLVTVHELSGRDFDFDLSPSRHFARVAASTPSLAAKIDELVGRDLRASARVSQRELEAVAEPILRRFGLKLHADDLYALYRSRQGANSQFAILREQHQRRLAEVIENFGDSEADITLALDAAETDFSQARREVMQTRSQASQLSAVLRPLQDRFISEWQSDERMIPVLKENSQLIDRVASMKVSDVQGFMVWADEVFNLFEAICVRDNLEMEPGRRILGTIRANSKRVYRQVWGAWTRENAERVLSSIAAASPRMNTLVTAEPPSAENAQAPSDNKGDASGIRIELAPLDGVYRPSEIRVAPESDLNGTLTQWIETLTLIWGDPSLVCRTTLFVPLESSEFTLSLPDVPLSQVAELVQTAASKIKN